MEEACEASLDGQDDTHYNPYAMDTSMCGKNFDLIMAPIASAKDEIGEDESEVLCRTMVTLKEGEKDWTDEQWEDKCDNFWDCGLSKFARKDAEGAEFLTKVDACQAMRWMHINGLGFIDVEEKDGKCAGVAEPEYVPLDGNGNPMNQNDFDSREEPGEDDDPEAENDSLTGAQTEVEHVNDPNASDDDKSEELEKEQKGDKPSLLQTNKAVFKTSGSTSTSSKTSTKTSKNGNVKTTKTVARKVVKKAVLKRVVRAKSITRTKVASNRVKKQVVYKRSARTSKKAVIVRRKVKKTVRVVKRMTRLRKLNLTPTQITARL